MIEESHYPLFCQKTRSFLENFKTSKTPETEAIFAGILSLKNEVEFEEDPSLGSGQAVCQEIQLCLALLKDINIRERRCKISEEIKKAEQEKNFEKVNSLIKEFNLIN